MTDPAKMQCGECHSYEIVCRNSTGAVEDGRFTEKFLCDDCGATGTISGRAEEPPRQWTTSGGLFA
jgi:hypothetical protein